MPVPCICLVCQATFLAKPSHVKTGRAKYCSLDCMSQGRRTAVDVTCRCCGTPFTALPNRLAQGEGKYCSHQCYRQYHLTLPNVITRFWSLVLKTDDCWLWQGNIGTNGYGRFPLGQEKRIPAHRFAYELTYGLILPGLFCLHHCDNRVCVRPDHLFLGTQWDNMHDMLSKHRHIAQTHPEMLPRGERSGRRLHPERYPRGAQSPNAKLTASQVQDIRRMYAEKQGGYVALATMFHVSATLIRHIVLRKIWQHIH